MNLWINDGNRHTRAASGYGQFAAALAAGLREMGHTVEFSEFEAMEACLFVCPPSSIRNRPAVPTAVFTMHETDTLPPEKSDWPAILNTMDLVITPTSWNKKIWEQLGVTADIAVVPLGVDDNVFAPRTGRSCRFLTVHENLGGSSSRENWEDTVSAYWAAFRSTDRVELVVKTWNWKKDVWQAVVDDGADAMAPSIRVVEAEMSGQEMATLYQEAWIFIKNANREGWSLPCSEAVACGTRVAATEIQPLVSHLPADTRWFTPGNRTELQYLMRDEYRRFQAEEKRTRAYTYRKSAGVLARTLSEHLRSQPTLRPVIHQEPRKLTADDG